jgi:hypothetical protein
MTCGAAAARQRHHPPSGQHCAGLELVPLRRCAGVPHVRFKQGWYLALRSRVSLSIAAAGHNADLHAGEEGLLTAPLGHNDSGIAPAIASSFASCSLCCLIERRQMQRTVELWNYKCLADWNS